MKIKVNKDIEKYDGGVVGGLSFREFIHVLITVIVGTGIIVGLSLKGISLTVAVYITTPIVFPIAYNGFYQKNGMTFLEVQRRKLRLLFGKRELLYESTESEQVRKKYLEKQEKKKKERR